MKFDQLLEYKVRHIFLRNQAENETARLFLFFKTIFMRGKSKRSAI